MLRWFKVFACLSLLLGPLWAQAQQTPVTFYARQQGNINYVATGGSLRTQPNTVNACVVAATSSQALSGIPVTATIRAAYLYWGHSGLTADTSVTLNGNTVNAARTFISVFNNAGTDLTYRGGFANVTALVTGNATMTFGGLTVDVGAPWCPGSQAAVGGWGLIVIYDDAAEAQRTINVYDGLQWFRGSALTLTPSGFLIPPSGADGKVTIITWEGDPQNSVDLNGFSESLSFNATVLQDGINVPDSNPLLQPYDGTVNTAGSSTSYGADVDTFDVTSLLTGGQTSATTVYSAGSDLVLLTAQVVSTTSEPVVDLSIIKSHVGNFAVGSNGVYTLQVQNAPGAKREDNTVVVTDTLPTGLTYVSATGTNWTCSVLGQDVTCTHPAPVQPGEALAPITLTVSVGAAAAPSVTNTATITSASIEDYPADNTSSDITTVIAPDLSTSTKTVVDLNGGEADPGDTLRYTITLTESVGAIATGVEVQDDIPANISSFSVVSIPIGATNASTGSGTGANSTGYLNVTGITVPTSGSVTVVFDAVITAGTSPGATIANTATVINPNGPDAAPVAPTLTVSPSQIPAAGAKPLYLRILPALGLSRTPATATEGSQNIAGADASSTWTLSPVLQKPFTVSAGNISVGLWLTRAGAGTSRSVQVTLANNVTGTIGTTTQTITPPTGTTPTQFNFVVPNPTTTTYPAGSVFTLRVQNTTAQAARTIQVYSWASAGNTSNFSLAATTVINVDSLAAYTAAYAGGSTGTPFEPGDTVYARAVVSDPFGSFDITSARITIRDPSNTIVVNNQLMTEVNDSGAALKTYEYAYVLGGGAPGGNWTMEVTAAEGTEGTVTDSAISPFTVQLPPPALTVQKISEVQTDPFNLSLNPKRIPGSVVRYAITVTNSGVGPVDSDSLDIVDPIPTNAEMYVGGSNPVEFIDGSIASGLTWNYATHVTYSDQVGGGPPFNYTPVPDVDGFDAAVRGIRIAPAGTMNGAVGLNTPSFTVRFSIRVP